MDISRDNYEEYFLLYADNELTDSEKAAVLMFVRNNKDLEEEFRMIHYTIAKPDLSIELGSKSFLLKNDPASFINEKNYEEVFVLYHDKELTGKQKNETEEFLYAHPQLKNDFDLIGLARLTAENEISFPNKKVLYKKEKSGKVISVIFWRMLAAAVFIGFGLWMAYSYLKTPAKIVATNTESIHQKPSDSGAIKSVSPLKKTTNEIVQHSESVGEDKSEKVTKILQQKKSNNNSFVKNVSKSQSVNKNIVNRIPDKITNEIVVDNQEIKNISKEEVPSINKIQPSLPKEFVAVNEPQLVGETSKKTSESASETTQPIYAKTASYLQNADNSNQNYVFYDVSSDQFRKTKVGGFLKKVKRVIERNNPITRLLSAGDSQVASN